MIESIVNENVLIDQIVLNNIVIKDIYDIDFLAKEGFLKINNHPPYYHVGHGKNFSHLSIKGDGMIVSMRAGVLSQRGLPIPFCFMTLSVPEDSVHKNLHCLSIKDYKEYIRSVQNHLFTKYGIDICLDNAGVKEIEINRTLMLNHAFIAYDRVFRLIMNRLPGILSNQIKFQNLSGDKTGEVSYYANSKQTQHSSRYRNFKIYDKTYCSGRDTDNNISFVRFEVRLIGTQVIKRAFNTNLLSELTDELITDYFHKFVEENVLKKITRWILERDRFLKKRISVSNRRDNWLVNLLRDCSTWESQHQYPLILDVEELFPIIEKIEKDSRTRSRIRAALRRHASTHETLFSNGDHQKLEEVMEKLKH